MDNEDKSKNNNRYSEKVKYLEKTVDNITIQFYKDIDFLNYIRNKMNSFVTVLVLGIGYTSLNQIENVHLKLLYFLLLVFLITVYGIILFPVSSNQLNYKKRIDKRLYNEEYDIEKMYYSDIKFIDSELEKLKMKINYYTNLYKIYIIILCITVITTLIAIF